MNRKKLEIELDKYASQYPEFKTLLRKDPRVLLERQFKISLPEKVVVKVIEDSTRTINLVIPHPAHEKWSRSLRTGRVVAKAKRKKEVKQQVVKEALANPKFRKRLIKDPKATISKFLQQDIPKAIKVVVLEETPTQVYLLLDHFSRRRISEIKNPSKPN